MNAQESLLFTRNARSLHGVYSPLLVKGLAHACLAMPPLADYPACNPALTNLESKPRLSILGNLSNGYSSLTAFQDLAAGTLSSELTDRIFASESPLLQLEASGGLIFFSGSLAIRYLPYDLNSYVVARNEANPTIEVGHVQSQIGEIQTGMSLTRDLRAGLRIQGGKRDWIFRQFRLLSPDLPKATPSWFVQVEPGLSYDFSRLPWKPRASFLLSNLAYQRNGSEQIGAPVDPQFGFSISPPVLWGDLSFEVAYRRLSRDADFWRRLHLGIAYWLGSMTMTGGVDRDGVSLGFLTRFENLNAGILFASTRSIFESADYYTQTLYLEAGWTF